MPDLDNIDYCINQLDVKLTICKPSEGHFLSVIVSNNCQLVTITI